MTVLGRGRGKHIQLHIFRINSLSGTVVQLYTVFCIHTLSHKYGKVLIGFGPGGCHDHPLRRLRLHRYTILTFCY